MTYVVALTGGICSGKSTITQYFQALNIPIIDADVIARDIVAPNTLCLAKIVSHFGEAVLSNQQLHRSKLRHIIFNNPDEKQWLENLLHPVIFQKIKDNIQAMTQPYCIVAIPLLAESYDKYKNIVDSVLVVDVPTSTQVQRLMQRDQSSESEARKIILSQARPEIRLKIADETLTNNADLATLKQSVIQLNQKYLMRAQKT